MRVLVCGDRHWTDTEFIYNTLDRLALEVYIDCIIEGDAIGVDRIAGFWARSHSIDNFKYPADWNNWGKRAGPIRNYEMLLKGNPDLVVSFHDDLRNSRGTKHMMEIAEKANKEVRHYFHPIDRRHILLKG